MHNSILDKFISSWSLSKYLINKFRNTNPDLISMSDEEINALLFSSILEVILVFCESINDFLENTVSVEVSVETKDQLKSFAFKELENRSSFFANVDKVCNTLCGRKDDIEVFFKNEQEILNDIYERMALRASRALFQVFAEGYSHYSSYDHLFYTHKQINAALLKVKSSLGIGDHVKDRFVSALMNHYEDLLSFFEREMDRHRIELSRAKPKNEMIPNVYPTIGLRNQNGVEEPKDLTIFDDLFHPEYKSRVDDFINILRNVNPQVIANDNRWCAPPKKTGVMRLFLKLLKDNGIISYKRTRDIYGNIVADTFPPLKSSFIDSTAKDYDISDMYAPQLTPKITALKEEILKNAK